MTINYVIYTTVDITPTGVRTKNNSNDWNLQRNQQRNLDTLIQTISLRAQPLNLKVKKLENYDTESYNFGITIPLYSNLWKIVFDIEHSDALGTNGELLLQDLDYVPIINGLTETEPSFPPVFQTRGNFKNISIISINHK